MSCDVCIALPAPELRGVVGVAWNLNTREVMIKCKICE